MKPPQLVSIKFRKLTGSTTEHCKYNIVDLDFGLANPMNTNCICVCV